MPIGILFWVIMIVALLFGVWGSWGARPYVALGGNLALWIVIALLGWKVFGPILK